MTETSLTMNNLYLHDPFFSAMLHFSRINQSSVKGWALDYFFLIFLLVVKVMKKVQKLDNCQSYPKKNVTPNSFIFTMASMTVIQLYH